MKKLFESWRRYTNEQDVAPGSFPVDGAGQSGIPLDRVKQKPTPTPEPEPETPEKVFRNSIAIFWSLKATGADNVYGSRKASIDIHGGNTDISKEVRETINAIEKDLNKMNKNWRSTEHSKSWEQIYNDAVRIVKVDDKEQTAFEKFIEEGMPDSNRDFKILAAFVNVTLPMALSAIMGSEKAKQKTKKYLSPYPTSTEPQDNDVLVGSEPPR